MSDTLKISLHEIIEEPISGTRPKGGVNFDGEIPSFGGENVTMAGGLTYYPVKKVSLDFFNQMNRGQLQELDVLINKDGANTGKSTIYRKSPYNRACINEHLFILRGKPSQLDQVYFHYLFQSSEIKRGIERKITGSAQPGLNSQFCRNFPLEIVPLPEQKKIASILTSVDEVIENTQKQINKLQDLKKATMNELLTKGIGHTEFKDSELGRIPKSWEVKRLEQLVEVSSPICYGILMPGQNVTGGVPVVKVKDIFDGVIHTSALLLTDPKIDEKYQRSRIQKGDLLITIRGTTGRTAVVPSKLPTANITQDTARIRIIDPLLRDFTRLTLDAERLSNRVQFLTIGQAVKGINLAEVRKLPVPMPRDDQEMKDINGIGKSISDLIDSNQLKLSQTQSLKKSLMQDLLTGKVRVTVN